MLHNRIVVLVYRCASFILAVLGILAILGVFQGEMHAKTMMYYTLLSNFLVLGMFGFLIMKTAIDLKKNGIHGSTDYAPELEMVCSIDIFLTFLVYWLLLAPQSFSMGSGYKLFSFGNVVVHGVTPILCILDYIFLTDSHKLRIRSIFMTLIFPLAYLLIISIVGACGFVFQIGADGLPVHYPYFFCDYDRIGALSMAYIGGLIALFLLLSLLLYVLDKKWNKKILLGRQTDNKSV